MPKFPYTLKQRVVSGLRQMDQIFSTTRCLESYESCGIVLREWRSRQRFIFFQRDYKKLKKMGDDGGLPYVLVHFEGLHTRNVEWFKGSKYVWSNIDCI